MVAVVAVEVVVVVRCVLKNIHTVVARSSSPTVPQSPLPCSFSVEDELSVVTCQCWDVE